MFENVLGQPGILQLTRDISAGALAPSLLFFGPPASGKGTAALELARVLSCENPGAPWNCSCAACLHHRTLTNPDVLLFGFRLFSAEIAAAAAAFNREPETVSVRLLFIRSVRKLLARFSPVLWEDDPLGNLKEHILALEENLDELVIALPPDPEAASGEGNAKGDALKKINDRILSTALKLEAEGISETVPVSHIRRAAYWSRLAPAGKHKFLIIENADRMQESARNSILKILEEPPRTVTILFTCARPESLIPTIVSRLRPYRFFPRDAAVEGGVIRRVFRETWTGTKSTVPASGQRGLLTAYLDSFLPVTMAKLYPLAAFFTASLAASTVVGLRKRGFAVSPRELVVLGGFTAPIAEQGNLGRPVTDTKTLVAAVLAEAGNFETPELFSRFLGQLLALLSESFKGEASLPGELAYRDIWKGRVKDAEEAVRIFNQKAALALERLFTELRREMIELHPGTLLWDGERQMEQV
ncbi:MAG: DNA polymerase III [Spirochaetaceae bacterium]|jgi:DNA polymerase-3 subunit gamma/tau|nr:DNA polymerase III [Spirochaetaceae bacterium]